jgi:hypothetical protein
MKFNDICFNREHLYSIGIEEDSGKYYVSIPVSNHVADYSEYYEIDREQFESFQTNIEKAASFADMCRKREKDALLIQKPGSMRGIPFVPFSRQ